MTGSGNGHVMVVHAPSGGGKTAFMAKIAEHAKMCLGQNSVVVTRFLGTSPASSRLLPVLRGMYF